MSSHRRITQLFRLLTLRSMSSKSNKNPYPVYTNDSSPNARPRLSESEFLRFETRRMARIVALDRPAALHAITYSMVNDLTSALKVWAASDSAQVIVLKGAAIPSGKKAFSAGGDVVALCKNRGKTKDQCEFLAREYALNHFIATHPKPIVAILDGIVMGGGAGLSVHGQFRIATENTVFAMPETAIGFWPDVGASFFLPRLGGGLGMYLGLTGSRLTGQDVYHAGLATHFIPSHRLEDVIETLASPIASSQPSVAIDQLLNQFSGELQPFSLAPLQETINHVFLAPSLAEVIARLDKLAASSSPHRAWAEETLRILREQASPTSVHTTFKLLQRGASSTIKTALRTELALAQNYVETVEDLYTGIDSKLISKQPRTPAWQPPRLELVQPANIEQLFTKPANPVCSIPFHTDIDFEDYPHTRFSLPTAVQIKKLLAKMDLKTKPATRNDLLDAIINSGYLSADKLGIHAHLTSLLSQHIKLDTASQKGYMWTN